MAKTDLETLVVRMEAQMRAFENELKKARGVADRETRAIEKRFADSNKKLAGTFTGLGAAMTRGLGVLGIGVGAAQAVRMIGSASAEYTKLTNALKITGLEGANLDRVMGQLFQSAQRHGTNIGALTQLYSRLSTSQKELNASQEDMRKFTDGVALALRVAGSDSQAASGALLQLSQAMGGGVIQAQEYNSMIDGARPLLVAVAHGLEEAGGSVAKLTQLVKSGQVSSEAFFRAFLAGIPVLEAQAGKATDTVSMGAERASNAFTMLVGKLDETLGASKGAAEGLTGVADAINSMPQYIDAAVKGLGDLKSWLDKVGSNPFWTRLGKAVGLKFTAEEFIASGMAGPSVSGPVMLGDEFGGSGNPVPIAGAKPISLKDFAVPGKKSGSSTVGVDSFERAIASAEKRIAVQQAETAAINEGAAARERARIVAELQAAAIAANTAAGLKNTEVTAAQNVQIQATADKMYAVAQAAEAANGPMASAARSALDLNTNLQNIAVGSVDNLASSIADVASGTETASEAFRKMARSILRDLSQMILKAALWKAVSGFMGGGASIGGGPAIGVVGSAGGMAVPTFMAGGGQVRGPGTSTSDSILARLSDGEFVVKASAARQHRDLLEMINSGIPRFARGGPVGASGGRPVIGGVVVHNYGAEVQTDRRDDGTTEITVRALTRDEQASPRMFGTMRSKYGISPQLVQR